MYVFSYKMLKRSATIMILLFCQAGTVQSLQTKGYGPCSYQILSLQTNGFGYCYDCEVNTLFCFSYNKDSPLTLMNLPERIVDRCNLLLIKRTHLPFACSDDGVHFENSERNHHTTSFQLDRPYLITKPGSYPRCSTLTCLELALSFSRNHTFCPKLHS